MAVSVDFESVEQIPHLLYDATFHSMRWRESLRQMEMDFSVLRCDDAGNNIDRPITLQLQDVVGIASYRSVPRYTDGEKPDSRPTELIAAWQLEEWKESSGCFLKINSEQGRVEFDTALQSEWLFKSGDDGANITIHFGANLGSLQILCAGIEILDDDQVIPINRWVEEYSNWWDVWHEHWDNGDDLDENVSLERDNSVRLNLDDRPQEIPQPIDREVFPDHLDAPVRILQPICDYLEGLQQRDWLRAARAFPWLDISEKINADHLADQHVAGPWFYAREIDQCWTEDNYACVTVRGVEYIADATEHPASARESVVNYELLKCDGSWIIWNWSQGWVKYGSAPALECRQPWHDEWSILNHQPEVSTTQSSQDVPVLCQDLNRLPRFLTFLLAGGWGLFVAAIVFVVYWIKF